jgi:hypothetical protein
MKRKLVFVSVIAVTALVFACKSASIAGEEDNNGDGPGTVAPEDIADSGATTYPQTETDAINLYAGAMEVFSTELMSNASTSSFATKTVTEQESMPLDWNASVGGGTLDINGNMTMSYTEPDESFMPEAETDYEGIITANAQINYQGSIDGVTLDGYTNSFTINGEIDTDFRTSVSIDIYVGTDVEYGSDSSMDADYWVYAAENQAVSILRDDGLGAKIVLYYTAQRSWDNQEIDNTNIEILFDDILNWLENQTVTMKVYDDEDELIGEYTVPISEISNLSDSGGNP